MNVYKTNNFDQEEKEILENLSGFTFWKIDKGTFYAKHETWEMDKRVMAISAMDLYVSLNISKNTGKI